MNMIDITKRIVDFVESVYADNSNMFVHNFDISFHNGKIDNNRVTMRFGELDGENKRQDYTSFVRLNNDTTPKLKHVSTIPTHDGNRSHLLRSRTDYIQHIERACDIFTYLIKWCTDVAVEYRPYENNISIFLGLFDEITYGIRYNLECDNYVFTVYKESGPIEYNATIKIDDLDMFVNKNSVMSIFYSIIRKDTFNSIKNF